MSTYILKVPISGVGDQFPDIFLVEADTQDQAVKKFESAKGKSAFPISVTKYDKIDDVFEVHLYPLARR